MRCHPNAVRRGRERSTFPLPIWCPSDRMWEFVPCRLHPQRPGDPRPACPKEALCLSRFGALQTECGNSHLAGYTPSDPEILDLLARDPSKDPQQHPFSECSLAWHVRKGMEQLVGSVSLLTSIKGKGAQLEGMTF